MSRVESEPLFGPLSMKNIRSISHVLAVAATAAAAAAAGLFGTHSYAPTNTHTYASTTTSSRRPYTCTLARAAVAADTDSTVHKIAQKEEWTSPYREPPLVFDNSSTDWVAGIVLYLSTLFFVLKFHVDKINTFTHLKDNYRNYSEFIVHSIRTEPKKQLTIF